MKITKHNLLILVAAITVVAIAVVSAAYSYRSYNLTRARLQRLDREYKDALLAMQSDIGRLSRMIEKSIDQLAQGQSLTIVRAPASAGTESVQNDGSSRSEHQSIDYSPLDAYDREFLEELHQKHLEQKNVEAYVQDLKERNQRLHREDSQIYDERLKVLYDQARTKPGNRKPSSESDLAYNQMLQEYPDSYATAVATAERALASALQGNPADVENYYNILQQSKYSSSVVTQAGVEALPAVQSYLVRQYSQNGRLQDAVSLLQTLETENPGSYVAVPGPQGTRNWQPVSNLVNDLRQNIQDLR